MAQVTTRGETRISSSKTNQTQTPERRASGGAEPRGVGASHSTRSRTTRHQAPTRGSDNARVAASKQRVTAQKPLVKKPSPQMASLKARASASTPKAPAHRSGIIGTIRDVVEGIGHSKKPTFGKFVKGVVASSASGGDNGGLTTHNKKPTPAPKVTPAKPATPVKLTDPAAAGKSIFDLINGIVGNGGGGGVGPQLSSYTQPFDQASQRVDQYKTSASSDIAAENAALRARLATLETNAAANQSQVQGQMQQQLGQTQANVTSQTDPILQQLQGQGANAAPAQAQIGAAQANLAAQGQNAAGFEQRAGQIQADQNLGAQRQAADIQASANSTLNANAAGLHGQIDTQRAGAERQFQQDSQQFANQQASASQDAMDRKLQLFDKLSPLLGASPGTDVRQRYAHDSIFNTIFDGLDSDPTNAARVRNDLANPNSRLRTTLQQRGVSYQLVRSAVDEYEKSVRSGSADGGNAKLLYDFLNGGGK